MKMGVNWSLYEARINSNGTTRTNRNINRLKDDILDKIDGNPSYKSVFINTGVTAQILLINDTTDPYKKDIFSLPNETFKSGDMVLWDNINWIVINSDSDKTIQTKGTIQRCNWILKWQKVDGTILSYPCIDENKSISGGEAESDVITLGDTQHLVTLPSDRNTILIRSPKRFILDKHPTAPIPYVVIQNNTTSYEGLVKIVVEQDVLRLADIDRIDLGICDYFSPTLPPDNPPTTSYATITSSNPDNTVTIGSSSDRTLTATFFNDAGVIVTDIIPVWTIDYNGMDMGYFVTEKVGNICRIKVKLINENYDIVGNTFVVSVMSSNGGFGGSLEMTIMM